MLTFPPLSLPPSLPHSLTLPLLSSLYPDFCTCTCVQVAENDPLCRRLSLTELMPIAWQRLTKYKLLINNILKSYKKDWDNLDGKANIKIMLNITYILSYTLSCTHAEEDKKEGTQIETAHTCVKVHCVDQRSRGESVYDILFFLAYRTFFSMSTSK